MEFKQFKEKLQDQIETMLLTSHLFMVDVDKDSLWNLYLESFKPEDNPVFRERREFDCNCCKRFIRQFGGVVAIDSNYNKVGLWDINVSGTKFEPSVLALRETIHAFPVRDIFVTKEPHLGVDRTPDKDTDIIWHHLYYNTPSDYLNKTSKSNEDIMGRKRTQKETLLRALNELTTDAVSIVLELIGDNNLHRGEENKGLLESFQILQNKYIETILSVGGDQNNFGWVASVDASGALYGIRNSSIGTLLVDLSEGRELTEAVKAYEDKVSGTNYKRPKPIFTAGMRKKAQEKIEEMGFKESLPRRFARIDDITANNVLFVDRTVKIKGGDDPFERLAKAETKKKPSLEGVEEISIEKFIEDVLPNVERLSVFMTNDLESNLVSLIAPVNPHSKTMFKWDNNFSWAYKGNVATSMKERVKSAGGDVTGDLRFSIQWDHHDDLDAHCAIPNGRKISYRAKRDDITRGELDVDIITPSSDPRVVNGIAVENITFPNRYFLPKGEYMFSIHNYNKRTGSGGFSAEIEFDGKVYSYNHPSPIRNNDTVLVGTVKWDGKNFSSMNGKGMKSSESSREIWGINTNDFVPVNMVMYSPNYWNGDGVGNKQYMFMLKGCKNQENPNGFYNEFLNQELSSERKVMEALGNIMKVSETDNQLSGLGFSSTKRSEMLVKVEGSYSRTLKIKF